MADCVSWSKRIADQTHELGGGSDGETRLARDAVELRGVRHRYGERCALEDLSLSLPAGATIGLIGPDGVGKSTLLGLIAGSKRLQQGSIRVLGADLARKREREALLPRLAFMPQGLGKNLYPTLSVHENVDFFGRLFGLAAGAREARIQRLLEATDLARFADRAAGKLSGGMKQKLSLCCSLVHDPELLILDEPTTGVDPLSRRQFWTLVDSLRAERPGMTVIVATAYMEEAERFEYLIAMDAGRVLASDWLKNVMSRTGAKSLEQAYIALLPADRRSEGGTLTIPPFVDPGDEPVIEAQKLTKRFGDFVAVDAVSFKIARGEIFGFLGSNGCGKTTTMKMLTGLLDVTSGSAKLLGHPIDPRDMTTRLHIGYMSQAFSLYEELTVRHNLYLHARLYRSSRARHNSPSKVPCAISIWRRMPMRCLPRFRSESGSACNWPPPASTSPRCCCSMSPPQEWTLLRGICSGAT